MSDQQIREYATNKGFHPQTLERWLNWHPSDKEALLGLTLALRIGENHLRDLMDWLEDIALLAQAKIHDILLSDSVKEIESDPRLGRADKLKRIKEQIRRLRFPRLSRIEDVIQMRIRELKLYPQVKLSVPPGLEGGHLRVEFNASSHDELRSSIARLAEAAEKESVSEIFRLLRGEVNESGNQAAR